MKRLHTTDFPPKKVAKWDPLFQGKSAVANDKFGPVNGLSSLTTNSKFTLLGTITYPIKNFTFESMIFRFLPQVGDVNSLEGILLQQQCLEDENFQNWGRFGPFLGPETALSFQDV